jgi:hypothetical protein
MLIAGLHHRPGRGPGAAAAAMLAVLMTGLLIAASGAGAAAPVWTKIADEGDPFSAKGTVRYGAGDTWIERDVDGSGECTNRFFGRDPIRLTAKTCEFKGAVAPAPAAVRATLAVPPPAPGPGQAAGAQLNATRLSGPAPLAVLFDATATSMEGVALPFHMLTYRFSFGDERGQSWAISGQPKNSQTGGPLAAHVFDLPGSYTVRLRVEAPGGAVSETSIAITVQDPQLVYAGSKTVCVSGARDYRGCPDGASRQSSLPGGYEGRRVLLRRGESFDAIRVANSDRNAQIGAYGEGAKPSVQAVVLEGDGSVAKWPDDVTVMDLAVRNGAVKLEVTGSRILLYRNDVTLPSRSEAQVDIGTVVTFQAQNGRLGMDRFHWPREIFLVENDIRGDVDGGMPNVTVMGWFMRSALLGNTINRATEHSLRIWAAHKTVIAHNAIGGEHYAPTSPGIRAAIKIHSSGTLPYADSLGAGMRIATSQVIVANNRLGSPAFPGSWTVGIGPQNADLGTVEATVDYIHENNVHLRGPHTSQDLHIAALRVTTRGNTAVGGSFNGDAVGAREFRGDPAMRPYLGSYFGQLTD